MEFFALFAISTRRAFCTNCSVCLNALSSFLGVSKVSDTYAVEARTQVMRSSPTRASRPFLHQLIYHAPT